MRGVRVVAQKVLGQIWCFSPPKHHKIAYEIVSLERELLVKSNLTTAACQPVCVAVAFAGCRQSKQLHITWNLCTDRQLDRAEWSGKLLPKLLNLTLADSLLTAACRSQREVPTYGLYCIFDGHNGDGAALHACRDLSQAGPLQLQSKLKVPDSCSILRVAHRATSTLQQLTFCAYS